MEPKKVLEAIFLPRSPFKGLPESYTLFGALCWGIRILYGQEKLLSMLESFKSNPPFLISSPFFIDREKERHLPKPILLDDWEESDDPEEYASRKEIKRMQYIPEGSFLKILKGEISTNRELRSHLTGKTTAFYQSVTSAHASINRITWTTTEGSLYNEEAVYIASRFGIFIALYDESYEELVKNSLSFVQLGGNRSTGMGAYELDFREAPEWVREHMKPSNSHRFISLSSLFYDDAFDMENSLFEPKPVGGVVDNYYFAPVPAIIKSRVMYISRGSNMALKGIKGFYGGMKEVVRDEGRGVSILQYGYAFSLYVRSRDET